MAANTLNRILVGLAGMLALALTLAAWQAVRQQEADDARVRFELRVEEMVDALRGRMLDYEQVLRGVAGLFVVRRVDAATWRTYADTLQLQTSYPGMQALGFAQRRDKSAVVRFVEPDDEVNRRSIGYDMASEERRRAAMERAINDRAAILTAPVTLRQETGSQAGVLLYLAVPGQGFVYGAFRAGDFLRATLGEPPGLSLRVTDITGGANELLFDDGSPRDNARFQKRSTVALRGRLWQLEVSQLPGYPANDRPRLVLAGGLAISLLLTILVWSLANTRRHARELARSMIETSEELERFRAASDAHQDTMLMVDAQQMRIVYANQGACRNLGYRRDELIGQSPEIVFADRDRSVMEKEYRRLREGGKSEVYRGMHKRKDGSIYPVEVSRELVRAGSSDYILGIARDIRPRLEAERLVQESQQRLALAVKSSGLALFDWDVASGRVHLGAQWDALLGGEPKASVTTIDELGKLVHPNDLPPLQEQLRRLLKGEANSYRVEHRVRNRHGDWIWIESVAEVTERDAEGRALRVTGTNADITARRALADMKNAFIAAVSHELRTPLAGIVASLELLKEGSAGELPPDARRFVEMAHANGERLNDLINDVLDLERAESGRLRLELEPVDVGALLEEAAALNAPYAEKYSAQLRVDAPKGVSATADRKRLQQIVANLVSNAAKFSPKEGEIRIAARADQNRVLLSVTDQGPGIPDEFKARIFGKFEQARHDKGGTGLGLAICKALVERMGGRIWCENAPDRGAVFLVELPRS